MPGSSSAFDIKSILPKAFIAGSIITSEFPSLIFSRFRAKGDIVFLQIIELFKKLNNSNILLTLRILSRVKQKTPCQFIGREQIKRSFRDYGEGEPSTATPVHTNILLSLLAPADSYTG